MKMKDRDVAELLIWGAMILFVILSIIDKLLERV